MRESTEYLPLSRATSRWLIMRSAWAVNRKLREEGRTDGASIQEVFEEVVTHRARPINYRTVATHLRILQAKDLLLSKKKGRRLYYRPVSKELIVVRDEIRAFLDNVLHDDPQLLDEMQRQLIERSRELNSGEGPNYGDPSLPSRGRPHHDTHRLELQ